MAILNPQTVPLNGVLQPTYNALNVGGDSFQNNGHIYLIAKNTTGAAMHINMDAPAVDEFGFSGDALDVLLTIPAGAGNAGAAPALLGPFSQKRHNDQNGRAQMTYPDGVTGLTLGLIYGA